MNSKNNIILQNKIKSILKQAHIEISQTSSEEITVNFAYRLLSYSMLALLSNDKQAFSKCVYLLIKNYHLIPNSLSIQFSRLEFYLIIQIGSKKFNDFAMISEWGQKKLIQSLLNILKNQQIHLREKYSDCINSIIPYLIFIMVNNNLDHQIISLLEKDLSEINIENDMYKQRNLLLPDQKKFFPNGFFDMSRAHGISGFITLLNTIKFLNININIPQSLIEDLENLIDKTYIEFNQEAFWYPFVLNDQKEMKRIGNYDFFKSQKYFWCSGTLGMNIAYYKFAQLFHLTKLISKCKVVGNSLKGKVSIPNNNYSICHGYSGPYIALKKHSISLDLSYQNAIINYIYTMRLSQNKDYAFIDGKISTIFALLICDDSNSSIEEFLKVIFFQN